MTDRPKRQRSANKIISYLEEYPDEMYIEQAPIEKKNKNTGIKEKK